MSKARKAYNAARTCGPPHVASMAVVAAEAAIWLWHKAVQECEVVACSAYVVMGNEKIPTARQGGLPLSAREAGGGACPVFCFVFVNLLWHALFGGQVDQHIGGGGGTIRK